MPARDELNEREIEVLATVAAMQEEFGPTALFEREAIEHVIGPAAGSLAILHSRGYIGRDDPLSGGYRLVDKGARYLEARSRNRLAASQRVHRVNGS